MIKLKEILIGTVLLLSKPAVGEIPLLEQFKQNGYIEICGHKQTTQTFANLYAKFDKFIDFLQANPSWAHKLYSAKERFIRSPGRNLYATNFFGLYNESAQGTASQIAFYYAKHFHAFICARYPELNHIPEIGTFLEACHEIEQPYGSVFAQTAAELKLDHIFKDNSGQAPILLKLVKYLPTYAPSRPHYDGSAFSLFIDSTNPQALLLAPYKSTYTVQDFAAATRQLYAGENQDTVLLIPGTLLSEFTINPTPHIVVASSQTRYATIAFAMRPNYVSSHNKFADLPIFKSVE